MVRKKFLLGTSAAPVIGHLSVPEGERTIGEFDVEAEKLARAEKKGIAMAGDLKK